MSRELDFTQPGIIDEQRREHFERIAEELNGLEGCIFAVVFGSAVESEHYRDIDVALLLDRGVHAREDDLRVEVDWGARLTRLLSKDVDVRVVNDAPVAFQHNVTKGVPIVERDLDAWPDFRERTWTVYLDMVHFFEAYFDEAVG